MIKTLTDLYSTFRSINISEKMHEIIVWKIFWILAIKIRLFKDLIKDVELLLLSKIRTNKELFYSVSFVLEAESDFANVSDHLSSTVWTLQAVQRLLPFTILEPSCSFLSVKRFWPLMVIKRSGKFEPGRSNALERIVKNVHT